MDIYTHFQTDEHAFIDRVLDWIEQADRYHELKLTDFLDPRQQFIVQSLVNRSQNLQVKFHGGTENAERKRACIAPDYRVLEDEDFAIQVLILSSDDLKISTLEHGDYLGGILGIGIKREKIGDLHLHEHGCHCIAASEIIEFIHLQLQQVHRVKVNTEITTLDKLLPVESDIEELNLSVASMRLDGIVSDVVRLSRTKVVQPIKSGKCKVNWKVETDPSYSLKEGDTVSLKGFGRFKVLGEEGVTKKGRNRVKIGKFV